MLCVYAVSRYNWKFSTLDDHIDLVFFRGFVVWKLVCLLGYKNEKYGANCCEIWRRWWELKFYLSRKFVVVGKTLQRKE